MWTRSETWLLVLLGLQAMPIHAAVDQPGERALPGYSAPGGLKARFSFRPIRRNWGLANRTRIHVELPQECNRTIASLKPPHFLMVSCPKCGTTALYHGAMCPHPHFNCGAKKKDSHWFMTNSAKRSPRNINMYYQKYIKRNFVRNVQKTHVENGTVVNDNQVVVDTGVYYYTSLKALANIKAALPCIRMLWILRNPLARARSQYYHNIVTRQWTLTPPNQNPTKKNIYSLSEVLKPEMEAMERCQMKAGIGAGQGQRSPWLACMRREDPSLPSRAQRGRTSLNFLRTGLYHLFLEDWMQSFPASAFHFVDYEDLKRDPWAVLDGMLDFLGMPSIPTPLRGQKLKNVHPIGINTRNARIGWRDLKEDVSPSMLAKLQRLLEPHNEALYTLVGRRLPWKAGSLD